MAKKHSYNDNNMAIAYYRFSSHSQNEASIDQQREAAQKYAAAKGYTIVREYEDRAISGTTEDRPYGEEDDSGRRVSDTPCG